MRIALLFAIAVCLCLFLSGCFTPSLSQHPDEEAAKAWLSDPDSDAINWRVVYGDEIGRDRYRPVRRSMRSAAIAMLAERPFVRLSKDDVHRFTARPARERFGGSYYLLRGVYPAYEPNTAGLSIYEEDRQVIVLLDYLGSLGPIQRYPIVALLQAKPARLDVLMSGAR